MPFSLHCSALASRLQNIERLDAVQTVHPHFKHWV